MKIAITGATGFVGRHLVQTLSGSNHKILCVGRDKEKLSLLETQYGVELLCADIGEECADWFELLGAPDLVIHLAWEDLNNYKDLNHLSRQLPNHMQFVSKLTDAPIKKLVVSGTCFEYGMQPGALQETDTTDPVTPYGTAKDTLRRFISFLQSQKPFSLLWLRYFYMHGYGQSKTSFNQQLVDAINENKKFFNMSAGEQLRDYLPVEKIALLTATLACDETVTGIYNICSGQPVSIRRIAEQKATELNSNIILKLGHYPYPDHEPMAFWGDRSKLDELLQNRKRHEQ